MAGLLPRTFPEYIQRIHDHVGTDREIGIYLGFSDGSRVGLWRKGNGRPDELNCVKLARWTGDDPLTVLRLAGYAEMADLLDGTVRPVPVSVSIVRPHLESVVKAASAALAVIETERVGVAAHTDRIPLPSQ